MGREEVRTLIQADSDNNKREIKQIGEQVKADLKKEIEELRKEMMTTILQVVMSRS